MIDVDRILVEELPAVADALPVPPGRLDAVLARTAQRRRRAQQARLTSLTLVVVLVAGVVASRLDPSHEGGIAVLSGGSSLRRADTGITWRRTDTTDALGWTDSQTAGGALYALSTAPGPADPSSGAAPPRTLYRSDDGVHWAPAANLGGDLFLSDLSARGDRLYGLGTSPASAVTTTGRPVNGLTVSWSDDGGRTWKRTALPVDVGAIASKASMVGVVSPRIAAGPHGVVAIATVTAELDLARVLPAGVTAPNGWALSDTGVDILGAGSDCPGGTSAQPAVVPAVPTTIRPGTAPTTVPGRTQPSICYPNGGGSTMVPPQTVHGVVRSFTWQQLGVDGDLLAAVQGRPMTFWSQDGSTFQRTSIPGTQLNTADVIADDDGFTLVATSSTTGKEASGTVALRSTDGRSWTAAGTSPLSGISRAAGQVGGRIAVVGLGAGDPTVSVLQGAAWSTASLRGALDPAVVDKSSLSLDNAGVGPLGIVAVLSVTPDPIAKAGGVTIRSAGYTLHVVNQQWAAIVTDASGAEVARTDSLKTADPGPLQFDPPTQSVVLRDGNGAELARFDARSLSQGTSPSVKPVQPDHYVAFSRDGTTWSAQPLADLAGVTVGSVGNVMVTGTSVIVTVRPAGSDAGAPSTVVIGTL